MIIKFNNSLITIQNAMFYQNYDAISRTHEIVIKNDTITQVIYRSNSKEKVDAIYSEILKKISPDFDIQAIEASLFPETELSCELSSISLKIDETKKLEINTNDSDYVITANKANIISINNDTKEITGVANGECDIIVIARAKHSVEKVIKIPVYVKTTSTRRKSDA